MVNVHFKLHFNKVENCSFIKQPSVTLTFKKKLINHLTELSKTGSSSLTQKK